MKFKYVEENPSKAQIRWGGNDDPRGLLEVGKIYSGTEEVHSFHTKIFLEDFPGKQFNSVWFDRV